MAARRRTQVGGRLVVGHRIVPGWVEVADATIAGIRDDAAMRDGPFVAPGFIDVHIHGAGGASVLDAASGALETIARTLVEHGVTSFVPSAVSAPVAELVAFAEAVRPRVGAPDAEGRQVGAEVLGFHLEGPFLSPARRGAHAAGALLEPAAIARADLRPLLDGLRRTTVAPELPGASDLIAWLVAEGVEVSLGHSDATLVQAETGFAAGAASVTHLFNAMSGLDHHAPGLAAAALADDHVAVELIADGVHVHPSLLPLVFRTKPVGRVVLVSDALAAAGTRGGGKASLGGVDIDIEAGRAVIAGTGRLAGSVTLLDGAVRQAVAAGVPVGAAIRAVTRNPADLLGLTDRGRLAPGQRADLVVLDNDLGISAVMRAGRWIV